MKPGTALLFGLLIIVLGAGLYGARLIRGGFSAAAEPSDFEKVVARGVRNMAIPADAKDQKNPFPATPENVRDGLEHFADHCAECHANDGSGQTEMGPNMYPKAPDMRLPRTQDLTDGELFYIIQNGVRLTGMPAWGSSHTAEDTWKLVLFIRQFAAPGHSGGNKGHGEDQPQGRRRARRRRKRRPQRGACACRRCFTSERHACAPSPLRGFGWLEMLL